MLDADAELALALMQEDEVERSAAPGALPFAGAAPAAPQRAPGAQELGGSGATEADFAVGEEVRMGKADHEFVAPGSVGRVTSVDEGMVEVAFGELSGWYAPAWLRKVGALRAVARPDLDMDMELARALEASHGGEGVGQEFESEEDMMARAIQMSQAEEEARQRRQLREQQDAELQESMLMDSMREEEARRQAEEAERLRQLEAQRLAERAAQEEAEATRRANDAEEKRARLLAAAEPPATEPDRADVMIRLPDGRRLRRAFLGSHPVSHLYDFVDLEGEQATAGAPYRLVSTMPRRAFQNCAMSMSEAGLRGQCALLVEAAH